MALTRSATDIFETHFLQEHDVKALAYLPMTQKRRTASALASRVATLHAALTVHPVMVGMSKQSENRAESRSVICTGIVGFKWNTGSTSSGGKPQVAGG
jgi:hypothetical protein